VVVLGQMDNTLDHTFESANRVYDKNQLCPTIPTCGGGNIQPKVIEETRCVGGLNDKQWGKQYHQQDRVYKGDIALAQPANLPEGSYKYIVAMRGRNPQNPNDRTTGAPTEQRLEVNMNGTSNTLTTVQKDNLVQEQDCVEIKQATKEGSIKCKVGGCYDASFPGSTTPRGRVQEGGDVAPTLTAGSNENIRYVETIYRIRKLTPRECWRLMGYTDADFDKASQVNSNTQLYKQAGNAIVKQVLMAIFAQMIPKAEDKAISA
jgi:DNA (cytosine-5)-methyltransferase 1